MTASANTAWRIAGLVVLALVVAAIVATLTFPVIAGVMKLGMAPGVTGLTVWISVKEGPR